MNLLAAISAVPATVKAVSSRNIIDNFVLTRRPPMLVRKNDNSVESSKQYSIK